MTGCFGSVEFRPVQLEERITRRRKGRAGRGGSEPGGGIDAEGRKGREGERKYNVIWLSRVESC